jgi:predicted dehydrogenase
MKTDISKLKISFCGVSHWHVPLYMQAVSTEKLNVISVSDSNPDILGKYVRDLDCKGYDTYINLLDAEKPDFVFAFGKHSEMTEIATQLISRKISFAIEKPLGLNSGEVATVKKRVDKEGLFCAVPFIWRYCDIVKHFKTEISKEKIMHMSFKFIAGPPSRYMATSDWMLKAKSAGSGCMTNLGVHFIDLALLLSNSQSANVLASSFHYSYGYDIEDYAVALLKLDNGATLEIETGYAYPMDVENKRDNLWTIVTNKGYYSLGVGFFEKRNVDRGIEKISLDTDSDAYYPVFVRETLNEFINKKTPTANQNHIYRVRKILDRIIEKAKSE